MSKDVLIAKYDALPVTAQKQVETFIEFLSKTTTAKSARPRKRRLGITVHDVPAAVAVICGKAYRRYVITRRVSGGSAPPKMPLPDSFIGVQAEIMGWKIAARDEERFKKYFPNVTLLTP